MSNNNQVVFKLNKLLDKKMALEFLDIKRGGIDFSRGIIGVHPELKQVKFLTNRVKKMQAISKYFDYFYRKHHIYLNKRVKEFQRDWNDIEKKFFIEATKIFKGLNLKNSRYTGYLSIIDCNPRFLHDKSFQVFYFHPQGVKFVATHEILHFLFFNYALKYFPELFRKKNTESGIFWDLSEIFNAVMHQTKIFISLHGRVGVVAYPAHKKFLTQARKYWQKNRDIDKWILATYKYLKEA